MFLSYILARNVRVEADLVDQLFKSSEKRLARLLLLGGRKAALAPPSNRPGVIFVAENSDGPGVRLRKITPQESTRARISTPAMTSERPMKTPLRVPKIHREWRTTLIL